MGTMCPARMPAPWRIEEQPGFRLSLDTASFAVQHDMPEGGEHGRNAIAAGLVRRQTARCICTALSVCMYPGCGHCRTALIGGAVVMRPALSTQKAAEASKRCKAKPKP